MTEPMQPYYGALNPPEMSGGFVVQTRKLDADGDNSYYVYTKTTVGDYLAVKMRDTIGSDLPPRELIRQQAVLSAVAVFAYKTVLGAAYSGSGWANYEYTASRLKFGTGVNGGSENAYVYGRRTNGVGSSVILSAQPDEKGVVKVSFMSTPTTSDNIRISWFGGERIISSQSAITTIQTIEIDVGSIAATQLTITNNVAKYMYLMAINMDYPDTLRKGVVYDSWAHYLRPSMDSYITSSGAAEYALRVGEGQLVGSYHGSEVSVESAKWLIDGSIKPFVKNKPIPAFKSIRLVQKTLIAEGMNDGDGINSGIVSRTSHLFTDGSITIDLCLTGSMKSSTVYVGMCMPQWTSNSLLNFNEVTAPRYIELSEAGRYTIGHCETVIYNNARTNRRVIAHCQIQPHGDNQLSELTVEAAAGNTSYAKARWALQTNQLSMFDGVSAQFMQTFV